LSIRDEWPEGIGRRQKRDDEEGEEKLVVMMVLKSNFNTVKETIIIKTNYII